MRKLFQIPLIAFCAFTGGFAAQTLLVSNPALATATNSATTKFFSYFKVNDQKNPNGFEFSTKDGIPVQNLKTADGTVRAQIAMFKDENEPNPTPIITLNDRKGSVRLLLRMAGPYDSPLIILKDQEQKNRVILGTSLDDKGEPFLATFDRKGNATTIFGKYEK